MIEEEGGGGGEFGKSEKGGEVSASWTTRRNDAGKW